MRIKKVLVSQPKPKTAKSPYFDLAEKYGLKIEFKSFIKIEGIPVKEFRQERINILDHSAVIFTSRTSIDHFFRICKEMRIEVPDTMKYFCVSESTAFYLQKYIQYRKRKIFFGEKRFEDMSKILTKHKSEKFLIPLSDIHKKNIPDLLDKLELDYTKVILYRTVANDLSDIKDINDFDIIAFYTPAGITSLFQNFPDYKQGDTVIAAFGPTTNAAAKSSKLKLGISAPTPKLLSMTMAIEDYIKRYNKENKIR